MHVTENGRTLIKRFAPIHIDNADGIVNNSTDPEGAAYEPARSNPSQLPARLGSPLSGVQGEETAPASGSSPRGAQKDEDLAAKCNFAHLPMPPSPAPARAAIVALPVDSAWAPAVTPPDAIPGGLPDLNVNLTLANDARAHANEDPELPAITGDTRDDIAGPSVEAEANLALSEKLQENISIVAIDAGSNPENHADIEEESISTARPQLPAYKRFSIDRLFHSVLIATGWREGPSEEAERAGASVSRAAPPDEVVHLGKRDREDENDQDDNRRPGTRTRSMGPSPSPSRILEALSHHD